jgi:hypothetical protein
MNNLIFQDMQRKWMAVILCSLMAISVFGQDTTQLRRQPYKLKVAVDKSSVYEEDIRATPYVLPNQAIQLYPGETVFIEIEHENGVINNVKAVDKITNPEKTLTIS